jgi:hypothetical protein
VGTAVDIELGKAGVTRVVVGKVEVGVCIVKGLAHPALAFVVAWDDWLGS